MGPNEGDDLRFFQVGCPGRSAQNIDPAPLPPASLFAPCLHPPILRLRAPASPASPAAADWFPAPRPCCSRQRLWPPNLSQMAMERCWRRAMAGWVPGGGSGCEGAPAWRRRWRWLRRRHWQNHWQNHWHQAIDQSASSGKVLLLWSQCAIQATPPAAPCQQHLWLRSRGDQHHRPPASVSLHKQPCSSHSLLIHQHNLLRNQMRAASRRAAAGAARVDAHRQPLPAVGGLQQRRRCRRTPCPQPLCRFRQGGDDGGHELHLKRPRSAARAARLGSGRALAAGPQRAAAKAAGRCAWRDACVEESVRAGWPQTF